MVLGVDLATIRSRYGGPVAELLDRSLPKKDSRRKPNSTAGVWAKYAAFRVLGTEQAGEKRCSKKTPNPRSYTEHQKVGTWVEDG